MVSKEPGYKMSTMYYEGKTLILGSSLIGEGTNNSKYYKKLKRKFWISRTGMSFLKF
jgi:hypothetical protein